ncbi:MAG TPA: hypothetical protein VFA20_15785 [Myxococcaceae bacterium]|nr:hypothetical protein [Myxococcaceae bacterium]
MRSLALTLALLAASACAPPPLDAPTGLTVTPAATANENHPTVSGTAPAGSTVTVYRHAACEGPLVEVEAEPNGHFEIEVLIPDNSVSTFCANASINRERTSGCSSSVQYIEDSLAPGVPLLSETVPPSPSPQPDIHLLGFGDMGTTIRAYLTSDCTGPVAGTATTRSDFSFDIPVTIPTNATTQISIDSVDAAGNVSGCAPPFTVVEG